MVTLSTADVFVMSTVNVTSAPGSLTALTSAVFVTLMDEATLSTATFSESWADTGA